MVATLRNSVEKLQGLLASLTGSPAQSVDRPGGRIDVAKLASSFVHEKCRSGCNVTVTEAGSAFAKLSDPDAFLGVLEHVVANALEASPTGVPVTVRVARSGGSVSLSIEDRGSGMSEQFIANELFRPLKSTKKTGFGIGAYQAREIMRDLGGDIDVFSKVGEGTTVVLMLPEFVSEREVAVA